MALTRKTLPLGLVIGGLMGISLFFVGDHYHLPGIPTEDFARGLWFGICIGAEILGGMLLFKARKKPRPTS